MSDAKKPHSQKSPITMDQVDLAEERLRDSQTDAWRLRSESRGLKPSEVSTAPPDGEGLEDVDHLIGKLVADRFLVKSILGIGGMGAVYLAEHVQLKKPVALKVLHGTMSTNEEVVARFEREAVAAGRLDHPGIVAAMDFGRLDDGSFYLALEFVDGESLADLLEREGTLPPSRALGIALQINDALCKAHAEGIVHRDLKPDNVMLARTDDESDFVKVVDFGIAKISLGDDHKEGLTRAGLVFGTPEYMAPEQAMGHEADARSDLYGVGMLLYEMVAGTSPFRADDLTLVLTAQIKEPPPPLPADVPAELSEVIFNLLQKDPALRPPNAELLAERLEHIAQVLAWDLPPPRTGTGMRVDPRRRQPSYRPDVRIIERTSLAAGALHSVQNFSMRPVVIGRKRVPLIVPVLALLVGVALGAAAMLANVEVNPTQAMKQKAALVDAEAELAADASGGDRDAISELRKLTIIKERELKKAGLIVVAPDKTPALTAQNDATPAAATAQASPTAVPLHVAVPRLNQKDQEQVQAQANRYMVLGRGYSAIKHYSAAVEMYRQAVGLDPHLSQDTELLLDIRVAIAARDAVDDALDFALHYLGAHGADLIYDVYLDHAGQPGMTPVVARTMRLAKSEELLAQATPELKVALRLQNAKYCAEYREILPEAAKSADDRSLAKLKALTLTRGCGPQGNVDCFVCLRKDEAPLKAAITQAETHPSPSFLTGVETEGKAVE